MMSISRLVFAFGALALSNVVSAQSNAPLGMLMMFNNNQLSSTKYCDPTEWAAIQGVLANVTAYVPPPTRVRRLLGKKSDHVEAEDTEIEEVFPGMQAAQESHRQRSNRKLCWCSPYCGTSGTGKSSCPGGKSARRREAAVSNLSGESAKFINNKGKGSRRRTAADSARGVVSLPQREMQTTPTYAPCDAAQVQRMHAALVALKPSVAPLCRALIDARSLQCTPLTSNCGIYKVNLINATSDTILKEVQPTGLTFCKSAHVSFQAVTEFFVGSVNFYLTGPNGYDANRTENKDPYYMYGNKRNATYNNIDGKTYPLGNFDLTITSSYMPAQAVNIKFTTLDC